MMHTVNVVGVCVGHPLPKLCKLIAIISRADVADFLVKQIDNDAFLHKTPVLTS